MSSLTISIIQTTLEWENKAANLQALEQKINSIGGKTELIILPEMFSTGFSMQAPALAETMEGETVQWMKNISARNKIVLTGSIIIKENEQYYNRLIWMLPNGQFGTYDKRHLFAYAEEDKFYTPGNKRLIASVKGWKLNMQVCYDLRFPVWARNQVNQTAGETNVGSGPSYETSAVAVPEYDILVYVANWPERRSHAWKTLLCARAIENQCFVIGVNRVGRDGNNIGYSGNSLVIDPLGEVLYHVADEEDVFTITLEKEHLEEIRSKFPFWKDSDNFTLL
ncbi:MAG: nitrilase family protein [Ferruginibacter sp.]